MSSGGGLIGALRVTLGLDSANFEAGTKRARGIAKRDIGEIQRLANSAKLALGGIMSVATATAFAAASKRALDYAGGLGELAKQAGISAKALQEQAAIGVDVGLTMDDLAAANARLSKTIGAAQDGNKKAAETFRQLQLDITGLTAESAMPKLIAAFERIKSPTDQARIASELFGRTAGARLLPMLNMTAKGFEEARQGAHELGLVLSDEAIESADAASDSLAQLAKVVEVNLAAAMVGGGDSVSAMAGELAKMVAALPGHIANIRNFAFASAEALRSIGPFGEFVANQARKAASVGLDNKAFAKEMRRVKEAIEKNPNDAELVAYGDYLVGQIGSRRKGASPVTVQPQGEDLIPRTNRGGNPKKGSRDRSADYLERFLNEMAGLADEQLRLQIEQTTSLDERAQLEARRIKTERDAYDFQVASRVKSGELTAAQGEELKLAHEKIAAAQQAIMFDRIGAEKLEEAARLRDAEFDIRQQQLDADLDMARSQDERRRVELRLLDLDYERERAAVEQVKAMYELNQATFAEVEAAERRLEAMEAQRDQRTSAINRRTMGPLESWVDQSKRSAAELKEAYEQVRVDALNNGLDMASRNVLKLKGAAGDLFNQLISDVIRLNMQQALTGGGGGILGSIGKLLGLANGDSGVSDMAASMSGMFQHGLRLPGMATGGSFMIGGRPGVDNQVLAIDGIPRARVSGTERIDVVPANDRGGSGGAPIVFDLRGAVMTQDLLAQMNAIAAARSAQVVGIAGRSMARRNNRKTG
jgi:hypothetical protein